MGYGALDIDPNLSGRLFDRRGEDNKLINHPDEVVDFRFPRKNKDGLLDIVGRIQYTRDVNGRGGIIGAAIALNHANPTIESFELAESWLDHQLAAIVNKALTDNVVNRDNFSGLLELPQQKHVYHEGAPLLGKSRQRLFQVQYDERSMLSSIRPMLLLYLSTIPPYYKNGIVVSNYNYKNTKYKVAGPALDRHAIDLAEFKRTQALERELRILANIRSAGTQFHYDLAQNNDAIVRLQQELETAEKETNILRRKIAGNTADERECIGSLTSLGADPTPKPFDYTHMFASPVPSTVPANSVNMPASTNQKPRPVRRPVALGHNTSANNAYTGDRLSPASDPTKRSSTQGVDLKTERSNAHDMRNQVKTTSRQNKQLQDTMAEFSEDNNTQRFGVAGTKNILYWTAIAVFVVIIITIFILMVDTVLERSDRANIEYAEQQFSQNDTDSLVCENLRNYFIEIANNFTIVKSPVTKYDIAVKVSNSFAKFSKADRKSLSEQFFNCAIVGGVKVNNCSVVSKNQRPNEAFVIAQGQVKTALTDYIYCARYSGNGRG